MVREAMTEICLVGAKASLARHPARPHCVSSLSLDCLRRRANFDQDVWANMAVSISSGSFLWAQARNPTIFGVYIRVPDVLDISCKLTYGASLQACLLPGGPVFLVQDKNVMATLDALYDGELPDPIWLFL